MGWPKGKGQTVIHKILHRNLMIEQLETLKKSEVNSGASAPDRIIRPVDSAWCII